MYIDIISSKSYAHRAYICAAVSERLTGIKCSVISNNDSEDVQATVRGLKALTSAQNTAEINCGESASTFRFLLPLAGALGRSAVFVLGKRLSERPANDLISELSQHGMMIERKSETLISAAGKLKSGNFSFSGDVSSQYISGILMAATLVDGETTVTVKGIPESLPYIDMTIDTLDKFGFSAGRCEPPESMIFKASGKRNDEPTETYRVEGDWSNAAYFIVSGLIGEKPVTVRGLNPHSIQGDMRLISILKGMGAKINVSHDSVTTEPSELIGTSVCACDIPDAVPPLALAMALAKGKSEITGIGRLKLKESDRLKSTSEMLNAIGADIRISESADSLIINGKSRLHGGSARCFSDHRIVMTAAAASAAADGKIYIHSHEAVKKSYPAFFDELITAGLDGNIVLV